MDLGISTVPSIVASGTTSYLSEFAPVFLLIGGIVLTFVIFAFLVSVLTGRKIYVFDDDDDDKKV